MQNRAKSKGKQGQWKNNQDIIEAEKLTPPHPGQYLIDFNRPIGQVFVEGRSSDNPIKGVTRAFVDRKKDGTIRTTFPVDNDYTLSLIHI